VRRILPLLALSCLLVTPASAQDPPASDKVMATAQQYTQPGPHHEFLERFLGTWETETRFTMAGMEKMPPAPGTIECSWLIDGRWIQMQGSGTMFGMRLSTFEVMGYDNFKKSYVLSRVQNLDTAMHNAEGDVDPSGNVLLLYGTLDEYLTGEHDKMVKTIYRFVSNDEILLEVHDLPIGEKNTKVIEMTMKRKEAG